MFLLFDSEPKPRSCQEKHDGLHTCVIESTLPGHNPAGLAEVKMSGLVQVFIWY